jgi:hypothetical protein
MPVMPDIRRGIRTMKGWLLRVSPESGMQSNTDPSPAGERRYGLDDRRGLPRLHASDRREEPRSGA